MTDSPGELQLILKVNGGVEITRADDVVLISEGVLRSQLEIGVEVTENLLTIRGTNQTVVYEIGEYDNTLNVFTCRKTSDKST